MKVYRLTGSNPIEIRPGYFVVPSDFEVELEPGRWPAFEVAEDGVFEAAIDPARERFFFEIGAIQVVEE